jgi:hypothetical protein
MIIGRIGRIDNKWLGKPRGIGKGSVVEELGEIGKNGWLGERMGKLKKWKHLFD